MDELMHGMMHAHPVISMMGMPSMPIHPMIHPPNAWCGVPNQDSLTNLEFLQPASAGSQGSRSQMLSLQDSWRAIMQ